MSRLPRVLLIASNVEREPYPVYPVGAAMVAAALETAGAAVAGLDLAFVDDAPGAVAAAVRSHRPDLVGIGVRAVDNTCLVEQRHYIPPIRQLVATVRTACAAPIVVGGSGYSLFPELLVEHLGVDFGVVGEGEVTTVELLDCLQRGADPATVRGLVVRRGDRVERTPPRAPLPVDRWTRPSLAAFAVAPHLAAGGMASVQTKRGCPVDCSYCTYPLLEGRAFRLRTPAAVAAEVAALAERGVDYLFFVDNNFNLPGQHAVDICDHLAAAGNRVAWTAFVTPHGFDQRQADAAARANARSLEFGSESAAAGPLEGLGKHHTAADILAADRACAAAGVTAAHYFIFAGPNETADTVEETLELISRLEGPAIGMLGLRVYPRTALHQRAVADGVVDAADDLLAPSFYVAPGLDLEVTVERLLAFADANRGFYLIGKEKVRDRELIRRLRERGRKGPLWEYVRR